MAGHRNTMEGLNA